MTRKPSRRAYRAIFTSVTLLGLAYACIHRPTPATASVASSTSGGADRAKTMRYLDQRADTWVNKKWDFVTGDHTCAISCHTTVPFMLASSLASHTGGTVDEIQGKMMGRMQRWETLPPYYDFAKESSRSTEGAMNVVVSTLRQSFAGETSANDMTRLAINNALGLQKDDGSWVWMDESLSPFEDKAATYWGNSLIALALSSATTMDNTPDVAQPLQNLAAYLQNNFATANLQGRAMALWASTKNPSILDADKKRVTTNALLTAQRCDGSWSMADLGDFHRSNSEEINATATESDGYATGLALAVLTESGISPHTVGLTHAIQWLNTHQQPDGTWKATSLNKPTTSFNNTIITDAASSYAIIGLSIADRHASLAPALTYIVNSSEHNLEDAKALCTSKGYRLPNYGELKRTILQNMLKCSVVSGWAWSSDQSDSAQSRYVFDFDVLANGQDPGASQDVNASGRVICVR